MSRPDPREAMAQEEPAASGCSQPEGEPTSLPSSEEGLATGGETSSSEVLQSALAQAQAQLTEQQDAVLRARAEMDNLRKRLERDVANAHKYALERFVQELLPIKDSLELGLAAAAGDAPDAARLVEGTQLTLKMFTSALEKFGVTVVDPGGESFDPEQHQAMSTVDAPEATTGTVMTVVQKGYLLNDRLVRPALVMVAK